MIFAEPVAFSLFFPLLEHPVALRPPPWPCTEEAESVFSNFQVLQSPVPELFGEALAGIQSARLFRSRCA